MLVAAVATLLVVSGSYQVEKYLGDVGVGIYAVAAVIGVWLTRRWLVPRFGHMRRSTAVVLAAVTIAVACVAFALVYPLADAGVVGGGSDSDDALNLGVRTFLAGHYPYGVRTYLDAGVTYLPGSLLLALPFTVLGNAAYQNVFWVGVLLCVVARLVELRLAVLFVWIVLALCPHVGQLIVTGGELLASAIYVPLAVLLAIEPARLGWPNAPRWIRCMLLGIALTSRFNYLLLMPVVVAAIARQSGWRHAIEAGGVIAATVVLLIAPFWLYDPAAFWRACVLEQNAAASQLVPSMPLLASFLCGAFALAASIPPPSSTFDVLLRCVAIQAVPVVLLVVVSSVEARTLEFLYAGYGLHFLFFGLLALWPPFVQRSATV